MLGFTRILAVNFLYTRPSVISHGQPPNLESGNAPVRFNSASALASNLEMREVCAPDLVRAVAQLGRAPGSGPGGRGFKSHQPDFPLKGNYFPIL